MSLDAASPLCVVSGPSPEAFCVCVYRRTHNFRPSHPTPMTQQSTPRNIRYRSPTGVRRLGSTDDPHALFAATDARHDRITAQLVVSITCGRDDLEDVVGYIDTRAGTLDENQILRCEWINAGQTLRVSTASGWLFNAHGGGKIREQGSGYGISFSLTVELNPTRFLAHQPRCAVPEIVATPPSQALRVDPVIERDLRASTLDNQDNVLIGRDYAGGTTFGSRRRAWWSSVLTVYLSHIEALLRPLFLADGRTSLHRFDWRGIRASEVYWDLETQDAVSWVRSFQSAAMTAHHAAQEHSASPGRGGQHNSRWLTLALLNGVRIKVYAKSDQRVRFEVTFTKRIGQEAARQADGRGSLPRRLIALTDSAERRMVAAFAPIALRAAERPQIGELVDFLSAINSTTPAEARLQLLRLLVNHGAVTPSPRISLSVCQALCRAGVLRRSSLARRDIPQFDLTPAYQALVQTMTSADAND